jgi:uncharacterized membrane protein YraQ (UPF0718 family)
MEHYILEQVLLVFMIAGRTLIGLAPYLIAGIILGELVRNLSWIYRLGDAGQYSGLVSIPLAASIGVVSPLCTYGTIPLIFVLLRKGFPLAPLVTFLIASSSLNPQLFFVTLGGIGLEMALVRLVTVLIFSMLAGFILIRVPAVSVLNPHQGEQPGIHQEEPERTEGGRGINVSLRRIWKDLQYIGFYVIVGCLVGAVIEVFVPGQWLTDLFSSGPFTSILVASILGVPVYVCGGGTIPVIGSLISSGMNVGAALAFLTVGQVVRITPLIALASLIRIRYLIFFVIYSILYSVVIGLIYQTIK